MGRDRVRRATLDKIKRDTKPVPADQTSDVPNAKGKFAARDHTLVQQFKLVVLGGPDAGQQVVSTGERMVIGKHPSCDLILQDETVSRFHCEISIKGRAIVKDLDSRNGTILDGVGIAIGYARGGSILTLGETRIRLDLGDDHVTIALSENEQFGGLVGRSTAMREVFTWLERAAATDTTVLLEGETGTGKEAAAEAIHAHSSRREHPFLVIDCGALPMDLLESELFGHERGAFTGALGARQGAFEAANGGTVFLDEIGELSSDLQPKLLRALEKREVKRVGSNHYIPIDVRILAATNRNLRSEVNAARFRSDLFFRLAVVTVHLPPLRDRLDDMDLIVAAILGRLGVADQPEAESLTSANFIDHLCSHAWPGNVRELRNYVERCLTLQTRAPLLDDSAQESPAPDALVSAKMPFKLARDRWNDHCERKYLEELLREHDNNVTSAARAAEIDRPYLYRLLWRHGLR